MYSKEQLDLSVALTQMVKDRGTEYAAGYLTSMVVAMLSEVKGVRRQQSWVKQIEELNGFHVVEVNVPMTGKTVKLERRHVGSALDPSTERYWSM